MFTKRLLAILLIVFACDTVQAQDKSHRGGGNGDEANLSIQHILAQSQADDEDEFLPGTAATNSQGEQVEDNQEDFASMLGVNKEQLFRDFMRLSEEMGNGPQEEGPYPYENDSDY